MRNDRICKNLGKQCTSAKSRCQKKQSVCGFMWGQRANAGCWPAWHRTEADALCAELNNERRTCLCLGAATFIIGRNKVDMANMVAHASVLTAEK